MTRALTFEGLTMAALGMAGRELRLCCAVLCACAPAGVGVTWGDQCYRVGCVALAMRHGVGWLSSRLRWEMLRRFGLAACWMMTNVLFLDPYYSPVRCGK
jgi:hypothetical protein